jgi:hypothetical protein
MAPNESDNFNESAVKDSFLESGADAAYMMNSLLIKLPLLNKLFSDSPATLDELALFVHEYTHLLQNTATISGLYEFVFHLRLLSEFASTMDTNFHSRGSDNLSEHRKAVTENLLKYLTLIRGHRTPRDNNYAVHGFKPELTIQEVEFKKYALAFPESHEVEEVVLTLQARTSRTEVTTHKLSFGTMCLNEGIAWELEKMLLSTGFAEDIIEGKSPPSSPYQVMRAVYEFYLGADNSSDHMIRCGLISLQAENPARTFVDLCMEMRNRSIKATDDFPTEFVSIMQSTFENKVDSFFIISVNPIFERFSSLGPVRPALDFIHNNFRRYIDLRKKTPFIELEFINSDKDLKWLADKLNDLPPFLFLQAQEQPNENGRTENVSWLSFPEPKQLPPSAQELESLLIFQSMNTFLFAHMHETRIVSTQEVINRMSDSKTKNRVCCHLVNSCLAPQALNSPEICKTRPWDSSKKSGSACSFGAGVAILAKGGGVEVVL